MLKSRLFTSWTTQLAFSEQEFRKALGFFPTGVVIVTAMTEAGERMGLTVSSFNSVSLSPPLVLFSVARSANSFQQISAASHYAVNILSENQFALSTRFAKPLTNKWEALMPLPGQTGSPIIPGILAALECAAYSNYDGGDHVIFVGRVVNIHRADTAGSRPLVFYQGAYHGLDSLPGNEPHPEDSLWLHGW